MIRGPVGVLRWRVLAAGGVGVAGFGLLAATCLAPASALPRQVSGQQSLDAFGLIEGCSVASHTLDYAGTQFVTIFGNPATVTVIADLRHVSGSGTTTSIHGTPNVAPHEVFEADADDASWTPLASSIATSSISSPALSLLRKHYDARILGTAKVAGRDTRMVELTRTTGEVASKMWLDSATSLPLRREVYDADGRLARLTAYLDFSILPAHSQQVKAAAVQSLMGGGDVVAGDEVQAMRTAGWTLPAVLGTLELVEVRRSPVGGVAAGGSTSQQSSVLHLVYSDGLSTVSVFQQAGRLDPPSGWSKRRVAHHQVWALDGVPSTLAWSTKGTVYTVVADAGAPEIEAVVGGLPAHKRHKGVVQRLHRGADRVMSWFNPFG